MTALPARARLPARSAAAAPVALAGLVACGATLALGAAGARLVHFVPAARHGFPNWLDGPLGVFGLRLPINAGAPLLLAMLGCYAVVVGAGSGALGRRGIWAAILVLTALFTAAPPLFSADVFGYVDYARLGVLHGLDPYLHGAATVPGDPVTPFVGWHDVASPYGPLFTLASYPLALLGVPAALWILKLTAGAAALGALALVERLARRRGLDPVAALALVGLNPVWLVYAVGGAHNDLLVMALALAGMLLAQEGRPAAAGAQLALAAAFKASAGLLLLFHLAATRSRRAALGGAVAVGALTLGVSWLALGHRPLAFASQLDNQQQHVATFSVPAVLSRALELGTSSALRGAASALFAVALVALLWRVRRTGTWFSAAGWATVALLLATTWLLPWYVAWLLPLAALSADRRLAWAAVAFSGYLVASRTGLLLS